MVHQNRGVALFGVLGFLFLAWDMQAEAATKPDLKVTVLTAEKQTTMAVPLRIDVVVRILNTGTATGALQFKTRLFYRRQSSSPWQPLFDWTSGALGVNGGAYYSRAFDFTEGGTYYFKAVADDDNDVAESSETNNSKTLTKTFAAGTPDLTPANLVGTITHTSSSGASTVKVEWDVQNIGDGKALGSFVTVLYVSKNGGSYSEAQSYTRSNLEKDASLHFSRSSSYTDFNSLRFRVITDTTHKITERQEGNNTLHSDAVIKRP
jgi:hypothetical protein